jgi:hypothetical protein
MIFFHPYRNISTLKNVYIVYAESYDRLFFSIHDPEKRISLEVGGPSYLIKRLLKVDQDSFLFYPISDFLAKKSLSDSLISFKEKFSTFEVAFAIHRYTLFFNLIEPRNVHNIYKDKKFYFSVEFNVNVISSIGKKVYFNPFNFLNFVKSLFSSVPFSEDENSFFINSEVEKFILKTEKKLFLQNLGIF